MIRRRDDKKATIVITYDIFTACWNMLSTGETYREQGADALRTHTAERARRRAIRQLERLGHEVALDPYFTLPHFPPIRL